MELTTKIYSIKEVSQLFDLPASTLRYYEEAGLLTHIKRNESGQRMYEDCHIHRLKTICCFKHAGMPISALQAFFAYDEESAQDVASIEALLLQHEASILTSLQTLKQDLIHVRKKIHYYHDVKQAIEEKKPKPEWKQYR